jgi:hypothetical protein
MTRSWAPRPIVSTGVAITVRRWSAAPNRRTARTGCPSAAAGVASPSLLTVLPTTPSPPYPCEHSVAAGAASMVLAYLFPKEAKVFVDMTEEAGKSRLPAGVQYPSDVAAGLDLGRRVANLVIERARADGSDAKWTGTVPVGPGLWKGEPLEPLMGTWKTWVLSSGRQLRLPPPPAFDSKQRAIELAEVKNYNSRQSRRAARRYIRSRLAGKGVESSTRLGRYRCLVERTIAWLHGFSRLAVRRERRRVFMKPSSNWGGAHRRYRPVPVMVGTLR